MKRKMTYKQMDEMMLSISKLFFLCLKIINSYKDNSHIKKDDHYLTFINLVKKAFCSLDSINQTFINNEFFFQAYPYWWSKEYTYPIFIKIRNRSISMFLEAFYETF